MALHQRLCLLFLCGVPWLTLAFGPRFEFLKCGFGATTSQKVFADSENEEKHLNSESSRKSGLGYALHYENRYEEIGGKYFQSRLFISEPFFMDEFIFGTVNPYAARASGVDDNILAACGEDCVECAIPDEYKRAAYENPIDVMAYLGIRRAEPISVAGFHHSISAAGDWE